MIEKLPDIDKLHVESGNESLLLKLACQTLWDKVNEIIDAVNELQKDGFEDLRLQKLYNAMREKVDERPSG
jgi:hypothetical protein